jgi:hypothetical protein
MAQVFLNLPADVHQEVWKHLVPGRRDPEAACFMFVRHVTQDDAQVFEHVEWYPIHPDGFLVRTGYHFELTDETRAKVIKRAHDLGASLVEFHSHTGPWPAAFSPSDQLGFQEFVPHVWWRLKGKPYLAIVVTQGDFDGLVWMVDPKTPSTWTASS